MEDVRTVDFNYFAARANERARQLLLARDSGSEHCEIHYIQTPPGGGSPEGLHIHDVDQIFYILSGTMSIEIEGKQNECQAGTLVFFPAGVPHRNWNRGSEPTVHLAINTPPPDPKEVFAKPI